jgi:hypothetical protein
LGVAAGAIVSIALGTLVGWSLLRTLSARINTVGVRRYSHGDEGDHPR